MKTTAAGKTLILR